MTQDFDSSLALSSSNLSIDRRFLIGGGSLYAEALSRSMADRVLLTRILSPEFPDCDTFIPDLTSGSDWSQKTFAELKAWVGTDVAEGIQEENGVRYEFQMWERNT